MWSVLFVFLSYLDRNLVRGDLLDAEKESKVTIPALNGTFCAKTSAVGVNLLYQVSDGAAVVRSFVSPAGKLLSCSVTAKQLQVKSFLQQCRSAQREQGGARQPQVAEAPFTHVDEAKEMCYRFTRRSERDAEMERKVEEVKEEDSPVQDPVLKRSKRGFTYPGTLWCGAGNMADNYDQLGEFAKTDSCCRTHDHCPHVIHAFSSNYGYTNFKWHSICHCDCDQTLRSCLRRVNDTSSRIMGQAFFNVIGVPCFDLTYEERCAERQWYGPCKRYEKVPIAVLRDAVPYDFGGIDVIDELTAAPPLDKDLRKAKKEVEEKEEKPEIPPQSPVSGPEPPSLTNVVTAAEDFIKVLATVSSSQSSAADSDKGETQSSEEKKKRKKNKKKKKTSKKHKGKGGKRKQKAEAAVGKPDEVSPAGGKPGEVMSLSNFVSESHKHDQSRPNQASDNEYELQDREEPSNEVMKDEPAMDKEAVSTTSSPMMIQKKSHTDNLTTTTTTTTTIPEKAKPRRIKMWRRKKSKKVPPPSPEEVETNSTDVTLPSIIPITPTAQPRRQSLDSDPEKRPAVTTVASPSGILKVKRNRSKERVDGAGARKRKKTGPIDAAGHENSSEDNLRVAPRAGTLVPTTETSEASHWPDIYGGKGSLTATNSSFSVLKTQRPKGRGLRRWRKTTLPLVSDLAPPATVAAVISTEKLGTQSDWRLFTTAPPAKVSAKRDRLTMRRFRKVKKKVVPTPGGVSVAEYNTHSTMTLLTTSPPVATTATLRPQSSETPGLTASPPTSISPVQLTIEKVRAQFIRKKRRKAAALSLGQVQTHSAEVS